MKRGRVYSLGVALLALGMIVFAPFRYTLAQAQAPVPLALPPTAAKSADAALPVAPPATAAPVAPPPADNLLQFLLQFGRAPGAERPITGSAEVLPQGVGRATISVPVYGGQAWPVPHPAGAMNFYEALPLRFTADAELAQLENDVINLARQAKGVPADEALRNQLKASLEKAFDRRLALQAEDATALKARLAKVEAAIDKRKALREKIVELRLQQLVTDPELEWDATLGRVSPAVPPTPYYLPVPTSPENVLVPPAPAKSPFKLLAPQTSQPAANVPTYPDASERTSDSRPQTPPEAGSFSRLDGPDATGLRAGLDQLGTLRDRLQAAREKQEAIKAEKSRLLTTKELTDDDTRTERLFAPVSDRAERQLKIALADVKKQIRLWELEMEGAQLALDSAMNTLRRVQEQYKAGLIPTSETESAALVEGQARIRVRQVEEILSAYQELLSNAEPAAADNPDATPVRP